MQDIESLSVPSEQEGHPPTLCCNYTCSTKLPYPVMWNEFNKVVQCHNCGQQWRPLVGYMEQAWEEKGQIQNLLGLAEGDNIIEEIRRIIGE